MKGAGRSEGLVIRGSWRCMDARRTRQIRDSRRIGGIKGRI